MTTQAELEIKLLYSIAVAGKSAAMIDKAITRLLTFLQPEETAFDLVRRLNAAGELDATLRSIRIGNYGRLTRAFREASDAKLDLASCAHGALEAIHGIGPKTARFFILWTRPGARYAALDTHVLKWLKAMGYAATPATPSNPRRYALLETAFLEEADARGLAPRDLDARIWDWCSHRRHLDGEWPADLKPRSALPA